jgi:N-acetylglucosamine-6-phosphate deacetylase
VTIEEADTAARRLGVRSSLVAGELVPGDVAVRAGKVSAVGLAPAGSGGVAVPGFIDIQVNGFAGVDFAAADGEDYAAVAAPLAATGVTAYQPTVISLPETTVTAALGRLAAVHGTVPGPRIIGMHLEGPFLALNRKGAHEARNIMDPDAALAVRLIAAGPVTMMTLAPERPEALELVTMLVDQGIVVSCGHSDATAAEAKAAFARGASAVTHLFNAQRPFDHREPGIVGAALDSDIVASIIVDGFHLAAETVRLAMAAAPGRIALITDAIAATGLGPGTFPLGDRTVTVAAGGARLDDGTLAGSVLTMDEAVRNMVDLGIGFESAVAAATAVPARAVGRSDIGSLCADGRADIVVLDDSLAVVRTLVGGQEIHAV